MALFFFKSLKLLDARQRFVNIEGKRHNGMVAYMLCFDPNARKVVTPYSFTPFHLLVICDDVEKVKARRDGGEEAVAEKILYVYVYRSHQCVGKNNNVWPRLPRMR